MSIYIERVKDLSYKPNVSNMFIEDGRDQPIDYLQAQARCTFDSYKHLKDYQEVTLNESITKKVKGIASQVTGLTTRTGFIKEDIDDLFSKKFREEVSECFVNIKPNHNDEYYYFCRTQHTSLKKQVGYVSTSTYRSKDKDIFIRSILTELMLCDYDHKAISREDTIIKLFLIPVVEIDLEFRGFVYKKRLTALCPQRWYDVDERYDDISLPKKILDFFDNNIKDKLDNDSYVIDVGILKSGECYFIETNPFGADYSSGSALYNWRDDDAVLTGVNICYRIMVN